MNDKETCKLIRKQPHVYGFPEEAKYWDNIQILATIIKEERASGNGFMISTE